MGRKQIGGPKALTAELLNPPVEKIPVHEAAEDSFGFRQQEIEIIFRFVGKIDCVVFGTGFPEFLCDLPEADRRVQSPLSCCPVFQSHMCGQIVTSTLMTACFETAPRRRSAYLNYIHQARLNAAPLACQTKRNPSVLYSCIYFGNSHNRKNFRKAKKLLDR